MECSINNPDLSLLMKHLVIGQRLKTPNFSVFHWSPRGSLVLHGPSMFAVKAKIYGVLYKHSSIAFDETSSYWLGPKNFSAFHWSPRGSLVSIGQHFVAMRVVHLPKSTETSLITESDQSGPNHQRLQPCTARTAWSDLDQAMRAVHSCNSWFIFLVK